MKLEYMISVLEGINKQNLSNEEQCSVNCALEALYKEAREKNAKKNGGADLLRACKRVLKSAGKIGNAALHGATFRNGKTYVCDGYRLIEIDGEYDLPKIPDEVRPCHYEEMFPNENFYTDCVRIDVAELKTKLKIAKEKCKGRRVQSYMYNLHPGFVNAEFLIDALDATGDDCVYMDPDYYRDKNGFVEYTAAYLIKGKKARAMVMPMHPRDNETSKPGEIVPRFK